MLCALIRTLSWRLTQGSLTGPVKSHRAVAGICSLFLTQADEGPKLKDGGQERGWNKDHWTRRPVSIIWSCVTACKLPSFWPFSLLIIRLANHHPTLSSFQVDAVFCWSKRQQAPLAAWHLPQHAALLWSPYVHSCAGGFLLSWAKGGV